MGAFDAKGYQSSLSNRYNSAKDDNERSKIKAEMNRVAGKTGVGVGISGGKASLSSPAKTNQPATAQPVPTTSALASALQSIKAPEYQTFTPTEFKAPEYDFSTDEELSAKANTQLSPVFTAANERQRQAGDQALRGQGLSLISRGMMDTGESDIELSQQNALNQRNMFDLSLQQSGQLAQLIGNLRQQEKGDANNMYSRSFGEWQATNNLNATGVNSANQGKQWSFADAYKGLDAMAGLENTQYTRDYQAGRDTVADKQTGVANEQWGKTFTQNQKQNEASNEIARMNANTSRINANKKGAEDGMPSTAGEREQLAPSTLFQTGVDRYNQLKDGKYKYPLYYAISSMLRDPEWVGAAQTTGASITDAIDALIRAKSGGQTAEKYFKTKEGLKLKDLYESLKPKKNNDQTSIVVNGRPFAAAQ